MRTPHIMDIPANNYIYISNCFWTFCYQWIYNNHLWTSSHWNITFNGHIIIIHGITEIGLTFNGIYMSHKKLFLHLWTKHVVAPTWVTHMLECVTDRSLMRFCQTAPSQIPLCVSLATVWLFTYVSCPTK